MLLTYFPLVCLVIHDVLIDVGLEVQLDFRFVGELPVTSPSTKVLENLGTARMIKREKVEELALGVVGSLKSSSSLDELLRCG